MVVKRAIVDFRGVLAGERSGRLVLQMKMVYKVIFLVISCGLLA